MKKTNIAKFLFILFTLFSPFFGQAEVSGYIKFNTLNFTHPIDKQESAVYSQNNRLTINSKISNPWRFEFSYEFNQLIDNINGIAQSGSSAQTPENYRVNDLNSTISSDRKNYSLNQNLDRIIFTKESEKSIFTIGRQQVSFGSSSVVNPLDVLTPFSFNSIDTEERPGVDGVRYRYQIGLSQQLDFGIVLGKDAQPTENAAFLIYRNSLQYFEVQPTLIYFKEALLIGMDFTTAIDVANLTIELANTTPKQESSYTRASLGLETNLNSDIFAFLEYHFNGAGSKHPQDYNSLSNLFAFKNGGVFFLGQNYLSLGLNYSVSPLNTLSSSFINNLDDQSLFISASWEWSLKENLALNIGFFKGIGESPVSLTELKSEFASYPDSLYTRIRYYF